eukprot:Nitzschia sp. Nitz4//scaffold221_size33835//7947//9732//NITZ4_007850-RA/size33835-processed-gene-0.20-mRNA-1//-1//CDS//3329542554//8208//frame0
MVRYDLTFFLCCCKSFLGDDPTAEDFYAMLGLEHDATADEIKRAYKKQSLQMHPDKLAQRGEQVTPESQAKFTRMKEAYEILSDPHKRETYDAIGERGMQWLEEPFSMDPQELAHNFAKSSAIDRSKIFAIFVAVAVAVLILPILICLHADGLFGDDASWTLTLIPLWLWNCALFFYHTRVIMMGPIHRPDHIPPEEWVDPLPMSKRYMSMVRFLLIVAFQLLVSLKLDLVVNVSWVVIFIPLYAWEATTMYKKWPLARMRIVTVEDLEAALGKPFSEFTPDEKELIKKRYSVVPSTASPEFEAAQKIKARARHDMLISGFSVLFVILLLCQMEGLLHWNWWFVFAPFWIMSVVICAANYQAFVEVQQMAAAKDPTLFGTQDVNGNNANYGSVGKDGEATPQATTTPLSDEEREELKAQVMASGKLQGAEFSSLWIISPFLAAACLVLSCLGCAIFGITEVSTDGVEFDTGDYENESAHTDDPEASMAASSNYNPPSATEPAQQTHEEVVHDVEQPPPVEEPTAPTVDLLDDQPKEEGGPPGALSELD